MPKQAFMGNFQGVFVLLSLASSAVRPAVQPAVQPDRSRIFPSELPVGVCVVLERLDWALAATNEAIAGLSSNSLGYPSAALSRFNFCRGWKRRGVVVPRSA